MYRYIMQIHDGARSPHPVAVVVAGVVECAGREKVLPLFVQLVKVPERRFAPGLPPRFERSHGRWVL